MSSRVDLSGLNTIVARLRSIESADPRELMEEFERIIANDNRRGVLAGLDKDGQPMVPVTYRPLKSGAEPITRTQRQNKPSRSKRGVFSGFGPAASGLHNNLTSSEYRRLDGPPLAPRRQFSRVITNLYTEHHRDSTREYRWVAVGAWREVVNTRGEPFLQYHFDGAGNLPVRDLRGVRPAGMAEAHQAAGTWFIAKLNGG